MNKKVSNRINLFMLSILGMGALVLCSVIYAAPLVEKPNFVFILTDDQGWSHLSVEMMKENPKSKSDYHQTPNLEKLAEEGMRFTSGYAPAAVCSPTRYSIQYGQTPARLRHTKVNSPTDHIDHSMLSIPKLLKSIDSDYKAAHFGKFHLDIDPSVLGYDQSDGATVNKDGDVGTQDNKWGPNIYEDPKLIFSVTERANIFMQQQVNNNNPFYLQISHYATHADVISTQETLNKYIYLPKGTIHDHPPFAAMTEDLDTGIGMVMNKIKELGIEDKTYIIFTSDNGGVPAMPKNINYTISNNYPLRRGKFDLTEGGIRVPFIVKGPGITPNSQCDVPVIGYDLLPTIADLAGYTNSLPENIDGGSFKNLLLNNGQGSVERGWAGLIFHSPNTHGQVLDDYGSAIRVGDYKLLKYRKEHSPTLMLFNLKNDIGEATNLASQMPEKTRDLDIMLDHYLINVDARIPFYE